MATDSSDIFRDVSGILADLSQIGVDYAIDANAASSGGVPAFPRPTIPTVPTSATPPPPPVLPPFTGRLPDAPTPSDFAFPVVGEVSSPRTIQAYQGNTVVMPPVGFDYQPGSQFLPGPKPNLTVPDAPTVDVPEITAPPEIVSPVKPTLSQGGAPTRRPLDLQPIDIVVDQASLPTLSDQIDYVDDPYSPTILPMLEAKMREVVEGGELMPASYWDRLHERTIDQVGRAHTTASYEARQTLAAAGFEMPAAPLTARLQEINGQAKLDTQASARNVTLMRVQMQREDVQTMIARGLALEELLVNIHTQRAERNLRFAVAAQQAHVEVYNAAVRAYQVVELAAKEFLLRLEDVRNSRDALALQEFDADLRAAGFALSQDELRVNLYTAEWGGEETKSRAYAAYADAIRSYVDGQRAAVEAYGETVQANNTILQGWVTEWDAYLRSLEPDRLKIQAHNAQNSHYLAKVQELIAMNQQARDRVTTDVAIEELKNGYEGEVSRRFAASVQGAASKAQALTGLFQAKAQLYGTEGQVTASLAQANAAIYGAQTGIFDASARSEVDLVRAATDLYRADTDVWSTWVGDRGRVLGTIASSALGATNVTMAGGADINTQYSYIDSEQRGWDYAMRVNASYEDSPSLPSNPPIGAK